MGVPIWNSLMDVPIKVLSVSLTEIFLPVGNASNGQIRLNSKTSDFSSGSAMGRREVILGCVHSWARQQKTLFPLLYN